MAEAKTGEQPIWLRLGRLQANDDRQIAKNSKPRCVK